MTGAVHTKKPICPYCEHVENDPWDLDFGNAELIETACGLCGADYAVTRQVAVTYSTSTIKGREPSEDILRMAHYERDAAAFYRETGMFAPGKSVPAAMGGNDDHETRYAAWRAWLKDRNDKMHPNDRQMIENIRAALDVAKAERGER